MTQDDWGTILDGHPIFTPPGGSRDFAGQPDESLELSVNTLGSAIEDRPLLSGRRQVMVLKDSDLVVAAGSELRIASLFDSKLGRTTQSLSRS